jgi:energy-converting hydrogenase Eha subunit C
MGQGILAEKTIVLTTAKVKRWLDLAVLENIWEAVPSVLISIANEYRIEHIRCDDKRGK